MKRKWNDVLVIATLVLTTLSAARLCAQKRNDEQLLRARETVWRSWFAGDTKTLEELVPPWHHASSGEIAMTVTVHTENRGSPSRIWDSSFGPSPFRHR
jgi:hypothetical protein